MFITVLVSSSRYDINSTIERLFLLQYFNLNSLRQRPIEIRVEWHTFSISDILRGEHKLSFEDNSFFVETYFMKIYDVVM